MGGYQNWRDFELAQITLLLLFACKMLTILHKICKEPGNIEFLCLNTWIFLDCAGCGWNFEYIIIDVVLELSKVLLTLI